MSRETLDGGADAQAPVADTARPPEAARTDLDLAKDGHPAEPPSHPRPAAAPPVRRRVQVLRTGGAALAVAVLAGALATVAEQRRAQAGAADQVRLLGAFVPGGSYVESAAPVTGTATVSGLLNVVNAGTEPVELTGATVSGVPTRPMERPRRIEPGQAVQIYTDLDLPCSRPVEDRIRAELRVVQDGSRPGPVQRETVGDLPAGASYPLKDQVMAICSGNEALAQVTRMEVEPDGTVAVDLESLSEQDVQVRVLLAPRMGAVVNGGPSVTGVVPAGGGATLLLDLTIADCERARRSIGAEYEALIVETGAGQPGGVGYVDGWQPSVGIAAFGFALARQC